MAIESLHDLTPKTFLEAGGAVMHSLSFTQARNGHLHLDSGVYLAYAGFIFDAAGVGNHSVVTQVGSTRTPTLEALEAAMQALPDGMYQGMTPPTLMPIYPLDQLWGH